MFAQKQHDESIFFDYDCIQSDIQIRSLLYTEYNPILFSAKGDLKWQRKKRFI